MSRNIARRLTCVALMVGLFSGSLGARDINVALTGDDAGPGTRAQPYRTLQRAQAEARASRRDKPAEAVTVWINPGDWPLAEPLLLTAEDSGAPEARVLYRAVPRAVVRLTGSRIDSSPDKPATPDPQAFPLVHLQGASYLMLRGLTIEGGPGPGVLVEGGTENVIAGCRLRNLVGFGVILDGGSQHAVQSCDIERSGGGVWLSGGDAAAMPRRSAGHRVINNEIGQLIPRAEATVTGVNCGHPWLGDGPGQPVVGIHVAHNRIHDVPQAGILLGGWDNVFEYNEIFDVGSPGPDPGAGFLCRDSRDSSGGLTIRHNFVHHSRHAHGIDLEAGCEALVAGNVVCQMELGAAFRYRPAESPAESPAVDCTNNLAVDCGIGFQLPGESLSGLADNLAVRCAVACAAGPERFLAKSSSKPPLAFGKNLAYDTDPGFADLDRRDFRLTSDSPVFQQLPGFAAIPLERIGLSLDKYRTELPAAENLRRPTKP